MRIPSIELVDNDQSLGYDFVIKNFNVLEVNFKIENLTTIDEIK